MHFIVLLLVDYYEKQTKKKIREEKAGRPIIQYSNICCKGKNYKLTESFFIKNTAENEQIQNVRLALHNCQHFLWQVIEYGTQLFLGYSCLRFTQILGNPLPFSPIYFSAKLLSIARVFLQYSNKLN